MSEDTTQIEDVTEDALLEETEQEVSETTEVSAEESQVSSLDETVLAVLRGQTESLDEAAAKKEEAEDEDEDEEEVDEATKKEADEDEEEDDDEVKESTEVEEIEEAVDAPKTKAEILNQMYKEMRGMKKSQLQAAVDKLANFGKSKTEDVAPEKIPVDGEDEGDQAAAAIKKSADAAKNATKGDLLQAAYGALKAMKKADLQAGYGDMKKLMAQAKGMDESFDLESEVDLLTQADSNLSEDFKSKAQVIFEAAINNKVAEIKESLEAQYNEDLQEELTHVRESLIEKIDTYLSYVVEKWVEDNEEVVQSKVQSEVTEGFIKGLQTLFTEHYIEVPEAKRDLVVELDEKVKLIEGSLEQAESDKEDLEEQLEVLLRDKIIRENSEDLTSTQVEKLNQLIGEATFESEEIFTEKVLAIKETFFASKKETEQVQESTSTGNVEVVLEGTADVQKETIPSNMKAYVSALNAFNANSSFNNQK